MSAAYISAIVAGLAVIVSGTMQFLTLRTSRENTKQTLERSHENTILTLRESRKTTIAKIVSDGTQAWEEGLRADIAELATITGTVDAKYDKANREKGWPGEYEEIVDRADTLMNQIWMRLDLNYPAQKQLFASLQDLYKSDSEKLWIARKEKVLNDARQAFKEKWSLVVGPSEEG